MGILGRLFGRRQRDQPLPAPVAVSSASATTPRSPAPAPAASPPGGDNWYLARGPAMGLRQVVLHGDPARKVDSRFETFIFGSAYSDLVVHPICTGFFRLDGDPGPFLMIRTDGARDDGYEAVEEMAKHPFRVAFSFAHLRESGVLSILVCSSFLSIYSQRGFLEMHYGLDLENTRNLISDALKREDVYVVLARGGGSSTLPKARYDLVIPIDAACKRALAEEWAALLAHHKGIARPEFQGGVTRLYQAFPGGSKPILPPARS